VVDKLIEWFRASRSLMIQASAVMWWRENANHKKGLFRVSVKTNEGTAEGKELVIGE